MAVALAEPGGGNPEPPHWWEPLTHIDDDVSGLFSSFSWSGAGGLHEGAVRRQEEAGPPSSSHFLSWRQRPGQSPGPRCLRDTVPFLSGLGSSSIPDSIFFRRWESFFLLREHEGKNKPGTWFP